MLKRRFDKKIDSVLDSGKKSSRMSDMNATKEVHFSKVNKDTLDFKVLGLYEDIIHMQLTDPPLPLLRNEIVTLVEGKFPLHDYKDTSNYAKHKYVLKKQDGTLVSGILCGFTYDCTYDGMNSKVQSDVSASASSKEEVSYGKLSVLLD